MDGLSEEENRGIRSSKSLVRATVLFFFFLYHAIFSNHPASAKPNDKVSIGWKSIVYLMKSKRENYFLHLGMALERVWKMWRISQHLLIHSHKDQQHSKLLSFCQCGSEWHPTQEKHSDMNALESNY